MPCLSALNSSDYHVIINKKSGKCIGVDGGSVDHDVDIRQFNCETGAPNQLWSFILTETATETMMPSYPPVDGSTGTQVSPLRGALSTNYCDFEQAQMLQEALNIGNVAAETSEFATCVAMSPYQRCESDPLEGVSIGTVKKIAVLTAQSPNS